MKIDIDWETFHSRYLLEHRIFVLEKDDSWVMYTNDEVYIVRTIVEKNVDHTENVMFIERYLSGRNIIKVQSIEEEVEEIPQEMIAPEFTEEQVAELLEEDIERKKKDYEQKAEYNEEETSINNGHYHYYSADSSGNGETHKTFNTEVNYDYTNEDHTHIIEDGIILDYNGHIHTYGT